MLQNLPLTSTCPWATSCRAAARDGAKPMRCTTLSRRRSSTLRSASPVFSGAPKAGLFQLGKWGTEIHPALEQRTGDVQVTKHRVSPFYSTTLMAQLSAAGIEPTARAEEIPVAGFVAMANAVSEHT